MVPAAYILVALLATELHPNDPEEPKLKIGPEMYGPYVFYSWSERREMYDNILENFEEFHENVFSPIDVGKKRCIVRPG